MTKEQTQSHMLQMMIETLKSAVENADSESEVKVYNSEIAKLVKRYQKVGA